MMNEKMKKVTRIAIATIVGIIGSYILNKMGFNNLVYSIENGIREFFMGPSRGGMKLVYSSVFKFAAHAQVAGLVGAITYVSLGGGEDTE